LNITSQKDSAPKRKLKPHFFKESMFQHEEGMLNALKTEMMFDKQNELRDIQNDET
jgi:hypothetical protein